jgi:hypothetical protein
MFDVLYVVATVVFFLLAVAYVAACERLRSREDRARRLQ